jgi:peptide/nickel transport system substrate-binding protein
MTDLNEGAVLPRHVWSRLPLDRWRTEADWFKGNLVTSGAFVLRQWETGQRVVLEAAPQCAKRPTAQVDRIVFEVVPHRERRIARLASGELDYVAELTPREAERLANAAGIRVRPYPHRRYEYVAWNVEHPLFERREARRAMTLAIDRPALVETLWNGWATVATGPIPTDSWAAHPDLEPWPYDPRRARELLGEMEWTDSDGDGTLDRSGQRFSFELAANADNPLRVDQALMIQDQLRRICVEARVVTLDFKTLVERLDNHTFEAALGAWDVDTSLDLSYAFHSSSIEDGYNSGGYREPEVDRLIAEGRTLSDPAELRARLHRLQELLHRDQPYTFLSEPLGLDAHNRRLLGADPSALGSFATLPRWWLLPG